MLISLDYLIEKYDLKIKGVSHFGAHLGQEIDSYLQNNINNIHLFEPQVQIFNQLVLNHKAKEGLHFYNFGLGSQNKNLKIYLEQNHLLILVIILVQD